MDCSKRGKKHLLELALDIDPVCRVVSSSSKDCQKIKKYKESSCNVGSNSMFYFDPRNEIEQPDTQLLKQNQALEEMKAENARLRQQLQAGEPLNQPSCSICLDGAPTILLEPCNHLCLCEKCGEAKLELCPHCRTKIVSTKKVFIF